MVTYHEQRLFYTVLMETSLSVVVVVHDLKLPNSSNVTHLFAKIIITTARKDST